MHGVDEPRRHEIFTPRDIARYRRMTPGERLDAALGLSDLVQALHEAGEAHRRQQPS